jgi:hypothetical protein
MSHLKFYLDKERGNVEDLKSYAVAHQKYLVVDKLVECRRVQDAWEIKVKWQGFDDLESTWEPLSVLQADVPFLIFHIPLFCRSNSFWRRINEYIYIHFIGFSLSWSIGCPSKEDEVFRIVMYMLYMCMCVCLHLLYFLGYQFTQVGLDDVLLYYCSV